MSYLFGRFPITRKQALNASTFSLTVRCPEVAHQARAGQFAHIKAESFSLRRPISICEIVEDGIRVVFEVRGDGTRALSMLGEGDSLDMLAPLGNGFDLTTEGSAIVVGGGIGVPPLLEAAKRVGGDVRAIVGFRGLNAVILEEDFRRYGIDTTVCTDDGSYGVHGFVTQALERQLVQRPPSIIYACGPAPMLKAVSELAARQGVRCQVSMEERMGCGVGACLVCACKTRRDGGEHYAHVCKDGPVFEAEAVVF